MTNSRMPMALAWVSDTDIYSSLPYVPEFNTGDLPLSGYGLGLPDLYCALFVIIFT